MKAIWIGCMLLILSSNALAEETAAQKMAYSDKVQFCTFVWKTAVEAKSLLASGYTEQSVAENLVSRHAYGPRGQVYRGSEDIEAVIRRVTGAMAMSQAQREEQHLPDFSSQAYLADCPRL